MSLDARILGHVSWLALALWPMAAAGQSTAVVPDIANSRALGTAATQAGTFVTIDGGTRAGNNLFHSFSQFSLGAGDTARWVRGAGDGGSVSNVISRVTGGQVSQISGTLDSTALPNASFYFINPAGIVFGAGARVNVPAAAYFSTASELRFANGERFAVSAPNGSTLSMAAPQSFGFVGGDIALTGVRESFSPTTASLSFVAGNIDVTGASFVLKSLDLSATGDLNLDGSKLVINQSAGSSGGFRINADHVVMDNSLVASTSDSSAQGGDISISARSLVTRNGSQIFTSAQASGAGGDIRIVSADIETDGGLIFTLSTADGAGGNLSISADAFNVNATTFSSNAAGSGAGGDIDLVARLFVGRTLKRWQPH